MKAKTVLVISDPHITYPGCIEGGIDPKAESCLFQAIKIIRPDECVLIGDIGEWNSMSPWQWKRRKRPPSEFIMPIIQKETDAINKWLDKLEYHLSDVKCNKIIVTQGNHEIWADNFALEEARPEYTSYNLMKIKERGYDWHEHGKFTKIGKLNFTHGGHFTGLHHAYKTVIGLSASCMYGHFHNVEFAHVMHLGGAFGAWSIGCLCKLDKNFLNHRPTSWSHAFAIVHVETDGKFHVEIIDVYNGVCWVYGHRLQAK